MKTKMLLGFFLISCIISTATCIPLSFAVDALVETDFNSESFNKSVDFFNYVRAYAEIHGRTLPSDNWHAMVNTVYINQSGFQLFYTGLENISFGSLVLNIPMQSFLMHYKLENSSTDVITASSFLTLLAFQENETAVNIPNSPDLNDTLYASYNLGFDLTSKFGNETPPELSSKTTVIPLTSANNKTQWSWGMRYTNLTALWWSITIDPDDSSFVPTLEAITRYNELTFTYNLALNATTHKVVLTENHVIGRMRELWYFPTFSYYNATGHYGLGRRFPALFNATQTIYQFLEMKKVKMSIVQFSTTALVNLTVKSTSGAQNVTDKDVDVSTGSVSTATDTGEKIFDASFGVKRTYKLYDYTKDQTETQFDTYNATTRTSKIRGFAVNAVFSNSTALLRWIPLVVARISPSMFNKAQTVILNMTGANYFYTIAYPTYSGFKVVHDPTYTMYYAPATAPAPPATPPNWLAGIVAIVILIAIIAVVAGLVMRRRKPQTQTQKR